MASAPANEQASGTLRFVSDCDPGFTRVRRGKGFSFHYPDGNLVDDAELVTRLMAVGLPPAYRDCWYCMEPDGHILATGYDDRGRKQYRYHPDFRAGQDEEKFARCAAFGEALPSLRKRVSADLRRRRLSPERAIAAVVRLLDEGKLRIGNSSYARTNGSYGASTLLRRHAERRGKVLHLRFRAKSGKERDLRVDDSGLYRFVRDVSDLPGQHLFQYVGDDGVAHPVGSQDVNDYIRAAMGEGFSAKHFRTFGASVIAFSELVAADAPLTIRQLTEPVAESLGNTPTIARQSYIHPMLIELCGTEPAELKCKLKLPRRTRWLTREERGLIRLLKGG
ncbi:MAG: DNA topoisomerase IB [Sphingobium sp.]